MDRTRQHRSSEVELRSEELRIEKKRFYFNLRENDRGRFIKIAEVSGGRSTIIVPASGWEEFCDMFARFVDEDANVPVHEEDAG